MSKSINNVVKASKNLINAGASTISVGAQLVADGSELLNNSVGQTPAVLSALLTTPFAAAKGYIMESEGVTAEVAEARAYRFIRQDLARTITEGSEGAGKLMVSLFDDDDERVSTVDTKEEAKA